MNKILWHAVSKGAAVFARPEKQTTEVKTVPAGIWLGVMEELEGWAFVIGTECTGWVLKTQLALCEARTIHINGSYLSQHIGYSAEIKNLA